MKYLVGVNVRGLYDFEIEAENEDDAREKAIEEAILMDRMDDLDYDVDFLEEIEE